MGDAPRISIVVPAFNEEQYIAACLESLRAQTSETPYEVIVVDNGSTDATAAIARSCGATVIVERRRGVCWARQAGFQSAAGEIVVSADADTCYPPGWLSRIERSFERDTEVVAVAGPVRFVNAPAWARVWARALFGGVHLWARVFGRPPYASACNLAIRKTAFDGYNPRLTQGGDELAVLRALRDKGTVVFDPNNRVDTSSRRVVRGFAYNVVFTFLISYLLEYNLSRLTRRSVFGSYPAFRSNSPRGTRVLRMLVIVGALALSLFVLREPREFYTTAQTLRAAVR